VAENLSEAQEIALRRHHALRRSADRYRLNYQRQLSRIALYDLMIEAIEGLAEPDPGDFDNLAEIFRRKATAVSRSASAEAMAEMFAGMSEQQYATLLEALAE
jgi:hypothetical protein